MHQSKLSMLAALFSLAKVVQKNRTFSAVFIFTSYALIIGGGGAAAGVGGAGGADLLLSSLELT